MRTRPWQSIFFVPLMMLCVGNVQSEALGTRPISTLEPVHTLAQSLAAPEAEKLFRRDPRWLGGDAALSITLDEQRTLWLFGDSFIATSDTRRRTESKMIRNSVAVQHGRELSSAEIQFYWREAPSVSSLPASFFKDPKPYWYWPGHGVRLKEGPLVLFLFRMKDTPGEDLGFRAIGYAMAIIEHPELDPMSWDIRLIPGQTPPFDALPATAVIRQGDYLVAMAIRQQGAHQGYLMRIPVLGLLNGHTPSTQWWMGDRDGWVEQAALAGRQPSQIIDDAGAECSIHWDADRGQFVHIATQGFGRSVIALRSSAKITGPWSEARIIYQPPESEKPSAFVYAAKAHPQLSVKGRKGLVVSYASSSMQFDELLSAEGEQNLYWPKLAVIPIKGLTGVADTR